MSSHGHAKAMCSRGLVTQHQCPAPAPPDAPLALSCSMLRMKARRQVTFGVPGGHKVTRQPWVSHAHVSARHVMTFASAHVGTWRCTPAHSRQHTRVDITVCVHARARMCVCVCVCVCVEGCVVVAGGWRGGGGGAERTNARDGVPALLHPKPMARRAVAALPHPLRAKWANVIPTRHLTSKRQARQRFGLRSTLCRPGAAATRHTKPVFNPHCAKKKLRVIAVPEQKEGLGLGLGWWSCVLGVGGWWGWRLRVGRGEGGRRKRMVARRGSSASGSRRGR